MINKKNISKSPAHTGQKRKSPHQAKATSFGKGKGKFVKKEKVPFIKKDKEPGDKGSSDQQTESSVKKSFKKKFPGQKKHGSPEKQVKLFNMKKKERKLIRKKKDHAPTYERSQRLKVLWEQLRPDGCTAEKKTMLLNECMKLIKGHAKELSYAHDTVRVLEWVFNLGTDEQKAQLFEELKEDMVNLIKSKYGKFFWIKVLQHGSKIQKYYVMLQFHGKVISLLCHTEAATVVEVAFNECANATQRAELVQEFYGSSYRYFKESSCTSLKQLLEKSPEQKPAIIQHMKEAILKLLQKSVIRHSIVHFILYEFFSFADPASAKEVIESLRDAVVEILHTREGSRVAMRCIWLGSAKDRKAIIKSFKTHVVKVSKEEHGHMVLLALFDCVDDTKLVEKYIISELINNLADVTENLYGRKVLLYLFTPRDKVHFHPDVIRILAEGDKNETSKKEPEIRKAELKKTVVAPVIQFIADNIGKLYTDNNWCITICTLLQHADEAQLEAYKAIASVASQLYTQETRNTHIIESNGSAFMLKKLLDDKDNKSSGVHFSEVLVQEVPVEAIVSWTHCNRGCFLLVSLLETEIPSVVEKIKEALHGHRNQLKKRSFKGAEILIKKLKQ